MNILYYPHPLLKKSCKALEVVRDDDLAKIERMFKLMYEAKGIGLAAPQVGWAVRLFITNFTGQKDGEYVVLNPRLVSKRGKIVEEEGCLSLPDIRGNVQRYEWIRLAGMDREGREIELEGEGLAARAFQHELDHLDGILFISKLSPAERMAIAPKLRELERRFRKA